MDNNFIRPTEGFDLYTSTNEAYRKWGFAVHWPSTKTSSPPQPEPMKKEKATQNQLPLPLNP